MTDNATDASAGIDPSLDIFEEIERLKRESGILNITDTAAYQKMKLENAVWLEVESIYRLSLEKAHDDDTEEDFAQDQLEVKNRIETLTQKDLEQTIREYPEKKAVVDGERQLDRELREHASRD